MRILCLHSDFIKFEAKKKALKDAPEVEKGVKEINECLVVLTSVEKRDEGNTNSIIQRYVKEVEDVAKEVKAEKIVIYPYVHLTTDPSSPKVAIEILEAVQKELKKDFEVSSSPFGYYKAFTIACKGHPMAELSREFGPDQEPGPNKTYTHLIKFLDKNKAAYRLIGHPPEGRTEVVSPMRGNKIEQAAHCIVVMVKTGTKTKKYVLAVVPGNARVDMEKIKNLFHGSYASFADLEVAERLSGCVSGTILPFTFNSELELVVDPRLLEHAELFFNAARLDQSVALKKEDYVKLASPRLEKISTFDKLRDAGTKDEETQALKSEKGLKSYWSIMDTKGTLHDIDKFKFKDHQNLKKFAYYEKDKVRKVDQEPAHVALMKKLEIADYEPGSDNGNMRYYPKGRLMKSLLETYITDRVIDYGGVEVETPIMYDMNHPTLSKYLQRFPARQYQIESDKRSFFLRFAACFGGFLMAHDATLSYKNLPLRIYEMTRYSFRREQSGELTGLRRLRAFTMPDCHALCADLKQAIHEFEVRSKLAIDIINKVGIGKQNVELAVRCTKDFYKNHKDVVENLVKRIGKPALVEMWDERSFYFILKYELNFVDNLNKAAALSTDQIDVENGERYNILFTDKDGKRKHPFILHLSPSGAVERNMYALLEMAAADQRQGKVPMLPTWLAPTQIRVIPVSEDNSKDAQKLVEDITKEQIRVDYDDRELHVGKKIREAETEWCSTVVVLGEKEKKSGKLQVRVRGKKDLQEMKTKDLISFIKKETEGMPFKKLSLPKELSKRPIFVG